MKQKKGVTRAKREVSKSLTACYDAAEQTSAARISARPMASTEQPRMTPQRLEGLVSPIAFHFVQLQSWSSPSTASPCSTLLCQLPLPFLHCKRFVRLSFKTVASLPRCHAAYFCDDHILTQLQRLASTPYARQHYLCLAMTTRRRHAWLLERYRNSAFRVAIRSWF